MEFPINGATDGHGVYGDTRSPSLHTRLLDVGRIWLLWTKMMPFYAQIHTVLLQLRTHTNICFKMERLAVYASMILFCIRRLFWGIWILYRFLKMTF